MRDDPTIGTVRARAYTVPTDAPEADGTFAWDKTTIVVVHIEAGGETGLGYSYTDASVAQLITKTLATRLLGLSPFDIPRANAVLWGRCATSAAPGSPPMRSRPSTPLCGT
ncbi:hypothetical protein [Methylobacterium mesophilicum]|uniref:hypothetical protein n=1 Tax=Methylobacterium mesophilicum TaxID=39956 RepID=UPI0032AF4FCF